MAMKIFPLLLLLIFQNYCIAQSKTIDSLKQELKNAKQDTAKLRLYIALGETSTKKDKMLYAGPALQLIDKLLKNQQNGQEHQKLIEQENALCYLFGVYYRRSNAAEWDTAITYLQNRLQAIEKTGDQKRAAAFLFQMARIAVDEKIDSALFRSYMLRSISISKEIKDGDLIVDGYLFMSSVFASAGNFKDAFDAIQSSFSACNKLGYSKGLARSHGQLGNIYTVFGENELAKENFQTSLAIVRK